MAEAEVGAYLTHLALERHESLPCQARARQALLFLYRESLHRDLGPIPVTWARPRDADGPRPHLVLEHLEGPRLSQLLRKHGALPMEQLLPLALELASALHYLAGQDVVHLDVKPSNVIMGAPARLIDLSVTRDLKGRIEREWDADGLRCRLEFPLG